MKNTNTFRVSKVQPQGVVYHLLDFCLALLIKVLLIKNKTYSEAYSRKASLMLWGQP